ncbi:S-layer homology domain-containing protein [Alkaliphilus sp. B6464]|uniref:S-layer homology domain-containing protein n=1 Tax=Alkaliphilus sp. B6464 TaxID=2731219 RepID=UPI001BA5078D|nr:S-layer homology domain-containing protein [Alkaliphilus sp. B6464]QUH21994.1 S-layer homology domain-containing protein [Alkaliphilus sp. B6464]
MNKKKFIAITVGFTIMIGGLIGGTALNVNANTDAVKVLTVKETSEKPNSFKDVKSTDWFFNNVNTLTEQGLISGYPDGTFKPNSTITVGEFVKVVVSSKTQEVRAASKGELWYMGYIEKAQELGLVLQGEFTAADYDRNITRGEISRMTVRAMEMQEKGLSDEELEPYKNQISDFNSIPSTLKSFALKAYTSGIISGYPDKTFKTQNTATRAEASAMIHRYLDKNFRIIPKLEQKTTTTYPTDKFVDKDGKELTTNDGKVLNVVEKEVIKPYYQTLDILENKSSQYAKIVNNQEAVTVFLQPKQDSAYWAIEMTFAFRYNGDGASKEYPYYIEYKQASTENKEVLKETLKSFFPTKYQELYDKMIGLYGSQNVFSDNKVWKYEGTLEGRKYFIAENTNGSVSIQIGTLK